MTTPLTHRTLTFPPGLFKARKATNRIVIHSLDTPPEWRFDIREVNKWHVEERGWSAIGYHYLIDREGIVVPGRPLDVVGAHQPGWNQNSVAIALAGGKGGKRDDKFFRHYTQRQSMALTHLIVSIRFLWPNIELEGVVGHHDHPKVKKACPCFNVQRWFRGDE